MSDCTCARDRDPAAAWLLWRLPPPTATLLLLPPPERPGVGKLSYVSPVLLLRLRRLLPATGLGKAGGSCEPEVERAVASARAL